MSNAPQHDETDRYIQRAANLIGMGAGLDDVCKALTERGEITWEMAELCYIAGKLLDEDRRNASEFRVKE
jgi:hypothetical protein